MNLSTSEIYPDVLAPRESAKWIEQNTDPNLIRINEKAVKQVAEKICNSTADELKQLDFCACEVQPKKADRAAIDWIFFIDSINFSFWSDEAGKKGHYFVTHNGRTYSGYFAACAVLNRALEHGIPLTSADFMAQIDEQTLAKCFEGDNGSQIPMLTERVEILRENGKILKEKFDGSFQNCLIQSKGNAQKLLQIILQNFPNFRDFAEYKGKKVSFLKRAQILVADLHNCLAQKDPVLGKFEDISSLTMFADYRVPQALAHLRVLEYSLAIKDRLAQSELLENGCELEVQLRAFSIRACDCITEAIQNLLNSPHFPSEHSNRNRLKQFCAVDVDVWLWLWRRENAHSIDTAQVPFHRCRSIFY